MNASIGRFGNLFWNARNLTDDLQQMNEALARGVIVNKRLVRENDIRMTPNYSWRINEEIVKYFHGPKISDFMTASSGQRYDRSKNEYFVRDIINGEIAEPYKFTFYQKPMTLADALVRARLAKYRWHGRI